MMYKFYDTTESTLPREDLPSEALCLEGQFIENIIQGYRTLYTIGRESSRREISQSESNSRDGARFHSSRREPREIRVGFQLTSNSAEDYMQKFNALKKLVRKDEVQMIFNDEPDKYFIGALKDIDVDDPGCLQVTGELSFHCADPYKYSVHEQTMTAIISDKNIAEFEVQYNGTVEAYPMIETTCRGNTQNIFFTDDEGNMIAVGTPTVSSAGLSMGSKIFSADAKALYTNSTFPDLIGRAVVEDQYYYGLPCPNDYTKTLITVDKTQYVSVVPLETSQSDYSDQEPDESDTDPEAIDVLQDCSGISFYNSLNQTSGINYIARAQTLFYVDDLREVGAMQFGLIHEFVASGGVNRQMADAEIILWKDGVGSAFATAIFLVYGVVKKQVRFRVDKDNPVSGLNGIGIGISRFGNVFTFMIGEDQYEYDASGDSSPYTGQTPGYVICSMKRPNGYKWMLNGAPYQQPSGFGFGAVRVIATNRNSADELVDIMRAADIIQVNCNTGEIRQNGRPNPDLGSIDNEWTEFCLRPGYNRIECSAETVKSTSLKPRVYTLSYREAWE